MPFRFLLLPLLFALAAGSGHAQGFAGLGTEAEGFDLPDPDRTWSFPADHGAHPSYRIEWWYLTANLQDENGTRYGAQWTLFRSALSPEAGAEGFASPQLWMGHAALTTDDRHLSTERLARGGIGQAGVEAVPFAAFIDEWEMAARSVAGGDELVSLALRARGEDFAYDLELHADGPLVFHGTDGFSVKSAAGEASHYYSQPFYQAEGTVETPEGRVRVRGRAWLDREFSSQPLSENQTGWDWFSLHLEGGAKLMAFRLRQTNGDPFISASYIEPDGTLTPYGADAVRLEPLDVAGENTVPVKWRIALPQRGVDVVVEALNPESFMQTSIPYWEGPVHGEGSHRAEGYLEMTGRP